MLWILQLLLLVLSYARLPGSCELNIVQRRVNEIPARMQLEISSVGKFTKSCWKELFRKYTSTAKKRENADLVFAVYFLKAFC